MIMHTSKGDRTPWLIAGVLGLSWPKTSTVAFRRYLIIQAASR
jgi:hypothetical protein